MKRTVLILVLTALGCSPGTTSEPETVRVLGTIDGYPVGGPHITLSQQGENVLVKIITYGPGCYEKGETEAEVEGLNATVTPYDYAPPPGSPCTRDLVAFEHTTRLHFTRSGTATVVVRGLTVETDPYGEPVAFERSISLN